MAIYLPSRVAKQPQFATTINRSNTLGREISFAWSGADPYNAVINACRPTFVGNQQFITTKVPSDRGLVMGSTLSSGAVAVNWDGNVPIIREASVAMTMGMAFQLQTTTDISGIFDLTNSGGWYHRFDTVSAKIRATTAMANTTVDSDATYAAGDWIYAVYVIQEGSQKLYINGKQQTATGTGSVVGLKVNYVHFAPPSQKILTTFASTRAWTLEDVRSWTANPWQIFEPPQVTSSIIAAVTPPPPSTVNSSESFSRGVGRGLFRGIA